MVKNSCYFLDKKLIINGEPYPSLRTHLETAKQLLDPEGSVLSATPVAFGLGDAHSGNFMVTEAGAEGPMLFLDYKVAGFHSPLLVLAKAIYIDAFFEIFYVDQLNQEDFGVDWRPAGPGALAIQARFRVGPVSRPIALAKLEYLLKPTLQLIDPKPDDAGQIERALGHALLVCALLTRKSNENQSAFLLNVAMGVRLACDMRQVFYEMFGCRG
ncbi:hypothetical protein PG994_013612 [Apiospora phragmitis]|uniref:Aminoglycoside phosphotransferase domain-containing protein n=1 Tax=Apiospora phragmitis TaxID=2905665 RepID=A0ABR1TBF7_9PEZI